VVEFYQEANMLQDNQDIKSWESLEWDHLKKINVCENILLTGAGFTCDFGGFLAEEMWTQIYNHPAIRSCPRVAQRMRTDFDYESIYNAVLKSDEYDESEKRAIRESVFEAYMNLDEKISNPANLNRASLSGVKNMLNLFKGAKDQTGFIFTLNQDLFIERHCSPIARPWVSALHIGYGKLDWSSHSHKLPTEVELRDLIKDRPLTNGGLYYIKLHGSINWKGHDDEAKMVIGLEKEDQIAKEPLLRIYVNLFKMLLSRAKRLLVIGYSFKDEHINRNIALAMAECHNPNLELYVISTERPSMFMNSLKSYYAMNNKEVIPNGKFFLENNKLKGYFPYRISQIFPHGNNETQKWRMVQRSLFSN
jgi:hypothetical protein